MSNDAQPSPPTVPEELWAAYFDTKEDVALENGDVRAMLWARLWVRSDSRTHHFPALSQKVFRTYRAGSTGPHVVLLHGGGYTSMTWSLVAVRPSLAAFIGTTLVEQRTIRRLDT